jgi:hypothetical protein
MLYKGKISQEIIKHGFSVSIWSIHTPGAKQSCVHPGSKILASLNLLTFIRGRESYTLQKSLETTKAKLSTHLWGESC